MDAVFCDFETTGDNAIKYQAYEFAAVPVIAGVIRKDLMWHTYIDHPHWRIQPEILEMVSHRLLNPVKGVSHIKPFEFGPLFKNKLRRWVDTPCTLGGKNFASFDWNFICALDESFRYGRELCRYSFIDIGSMMMDNTDHKIPSLDACRTRAIAEGAPISVENTHYAKDDALLCAELFVWDMTGKILYGRPHATVPNTVQVYKEAG